MNRIHFNTTDVFRCLQVDGPRTAGLGGGGVLKSGSVRYLIRVSSFVIVRSGLPVKVLPLHNQSKNRPNLTVINRVNSRPK